MQRRPDHALMNKKEKLLSRLGLGWVGLVGFYGIKCQKYFYFKLFEQLYITIQFSEVQFQCQKQFNFKQFSLA